MRVRVLPLVFCWRSSTVERLRAVSPIPRLMNSNHTASAPGPVRKPNRMDESKLIRITQPSDGESLCRTCYWAHAQKGFRESEEIVFCAFGPMRRVPFKVRDCTDYLNRTLPTRRQMEDIALIIPTDPARKRIGFSERNDDFNSEDEEEVTSNTE